MWRGIMTVLAWAWMILIGFLLITPEGVFCIVCGKPLNVPGYIGTPMIMLLAIVSIIIGILGFVATIKTLSAGRR